MMNFNQIPFHNSLINQSYGTISEVSQKLKQEPEGRYMYHMMNFNQIPFHNSLINQSYGTISEVNQKLNLNENSFFAVYTPPLYSQHQILFIHTVVYSFRNVHLQNDYKCQLPDISTNKSSTTITQIVYNDLVENYIDFTLTSYLHF